MEFTQEQMVIKKQIELFLLPSGQKIECVMKPYYRKLDNSLIFLLIIKVSRQRINQPTNAYERILVLL